MWMVLPELEKKPYVKPEWLIEYEDVTIKEYAAIATKETASFYAAKAAWAIASSREHSQK